MPIHTYIKTIKDNGNYGGDFEISLAYDINKINIAEYKAILKLCDKKTWDDLLFIYQNKI